MAEGSFNREFGRIHAKMQAKADQQLQEFRRAYKILSPGERKTLRSVVRQVAEQNERLSGLSGDLSFNLTVNHYECNHEGEVMYSGDGSLSPRSIMRAIDAWDRGEEFTPKGFML